MVNAIIIETLVSFFALGVGLLFAGYQMILARREVSYTRRILELLEDRLK